MGVEGKRRAGAAFVRSKGLSDIPDFLKAKSGEQEISREEMVFL